MPRVSVGKSGPIRAHCASENQKKSDISIASSLETMNHASPALGIPLMGPDPRLPTHGCFLRNLFFSSSSLRISSKAAHALRPRSESLPSKRSARSGRVGGSFGSFLEKSSDADLLREIAHLFQSFMTGVYGQSSSGSGIVSFLSGNARFRFAMNRSQLGEALISAMTAARCSFSFGCPRPGVNH